MRDYRAFGGVLRSEIDFPELQIVHGGHAPTWTLVVERGEAPSRELRQVGERLVGIERYKLWRSSEGLRLQYSHAGTFDISTDGASLVWYYDRDAIPELVRSIVLGPAIALALELSGFLCLHGSAVALDDGAVAFLGPKHFGKSTLATALTAEGARLLGDDLLVVSPGPPACVRPGVASVRLWADMADALPLQTICDTLIPGVKTTATGFSRQAVAALPAQLRDIYVLAPTARESIASPVMRTRLAPVAAAVALAHQTKLPDSLVGLHAAGSQLATAAAVAKTVPVWTLHILRDVSRLKTVVRQIIDWRCGE